MNHEFHFNAMFLIARKAGYNLAEAETIAHASQLVDDNSMIFTISPETDNEYSNYISQTMNIYKPKKKLFRIYPIFHFIPGDPDYPNAARCDGNANLLNTTPNSRNAQAIFKTALKTNDLMKIGIACHAYADTWAHSDFMGYWNDFNAMKDDMLAVALPNVGHADAKHQPDEVGLIWKDSRLMQPQKDNNARFIEAAIHIFRGLYKGELSNVREMELAGELDYVFSGADEKERYRRAQKIAFREYGEIMPDYSASGWFDDAVITIKQKRLLLFNSTSYMWRDYYNYQESNWYKFQEAIKEYQDMAWEILDESVFSKMKLSEL